MNQTKSINQFSWNRVKLLCKRYIAINRKSQLISLGIVVGLLVIFWFLSVNAGSYSREGISSLYATAFLLFGIAGLLFTSSIFDELHKPETAHLSLMLPATSLEKLFSAWLVTAIGFTVIYMVSFFLLFTGLQLVTILFNAGGVGFQFFNPFDPDTLNSISSYLYFQSFFLLGAVVFKKHNFLKTLLAWVLFLILMMIGMFLLAAIFLQSGTFDYNIVMTGNRVEFAVKTLLTLFFLWLAYVRLKNRQVA
ncbi:MAG: hypothetical protein JJU46_00210 [Balneolaceae bacterium]|nr:hypothetical protein [Balneolaceae bacterium]MCH8550039.1 hypothetical protein [Balneolaceae bacterium]